MHSDFQRATLPAVATLRELREERLLTQGELALKAGLVRRTVANIEAGRSAAQLVTRRRLLAVLGVPEERHVEVFGALVRIRRGGGA